MSLTLTSLTSWHAKGGPSMMLQGILSTTLCGVVASGTMTLLMPKRLRTSNVASTGSEVWRRWMEPRKDCSSWRLIPAMSSLLWRTCMQHLHDSFHRRKPCTYSCWSTCKPGMVHYSSKSWAPMSCSIECLQHCGTILGKIPGRCRDKAKAMPQPLPSPSTPGQTMLSVGSGS